MTKQLMSSTLNIEKIFNKQNKHSNRTSYMRREESIPLSIYKDIFLDTVHLFNNIYKPKNNKNKDPLIIAVDGTYTNKYDKNRDYKEVLNMGYFNISDGVPIDLIYEGSEKKNGELRRFMKYIDDNKLTNFILVADRAYFSYEFIDFLEDRNISYIIPLRSNSLLLRDKKNMSKRTISLKNNSRVVHIEKYIKLTTPLKDNKKADIHENYSCDYLTNLKDKTIYPDKKIDKIYKSRWDIEVFFKFMKTNFNYAHCNEKDNTSAQKSIYSMLTLYYISNMLEYKFIEQKESSKTNNVYKVNKSNIINGIYDKLLKDIVYGNLSCKLLSAFCNAYIIKFKNETNRFFPRISKRPFSKWYVKKYHNIYDQTQIIDSILKDDFSKLNKNLSIRAKKTTVIKVYSNG
jgi:hypothetical protein